MPKKTNPMSIADDEVVMTVDALVYYIESSKECPFETMRDITFQSIEMLSRNDMLQPKHLTMLFHFERLISSIYKAQQRKLN